MAKVAPVLILRIALFFGVFASATLLVEHMSTGDAAFCGVGSGCAAVRASSISNIQGVPLPAVGLAALGGLLVLSLFARQKSNFQLIAAASAAGAAIALVLIGVQAFQVKAFCGWCMLTDVSAIIAAGGAALMQKRAAASDEEADGYIDLNQRPAPTFAWLGAIVLVMGAPFLWAQYPSVPPLPAPIKALQVQGKTTIVSFTDFECPYCRKGHAVLREIEDLDGERIAVVRKMMPLPKHKGARPAALAYLCVPEPKQKEMAHFLYNLPEMLLMKEGVVAVAVQLGLDKKTVEACMASPETKAALEKDVALFEAVNIKALPLTFVGPRVVMGFNEERLRRSVALSLEGDHPSLPVWAMIAFAAVLAGAASFVTLRSIAREAEKTA